MMPIKVGNKVKVIKLNDDYEHLKGLKGQIGTVALISEEPETPFPINVVFESHNDLNQFDNMVFEEDELELVEDGGS